MKKAVVLLSGGLDSTTVLYWAKSKKRKVHALIFSYGQKHSKEVKKAIKIAKVSHTPYTVMRIHLPWGGSSLIEKNKKIPKGRTKRDSIPTTYVPARNTIFLSYAFSFCEAKNFSEILIGANARDFSGYPDCRPFFYKNFNKLLKVAGVKKIKVKAPLLKKTKSQIVKLALKLKAPLHLTWSCYRGGKKPCGRCDACLLRAKGFREAGISDPALK
ncbi:MAG: 7-cyano-7-deazaguanine synthase QueC [Elusimicrobia bacterium]|nr:7-cyano-7-deazaguanine synthase QueC [Elusimicrobiota bacterium]